MVLFKCECGKEFTADTTQSGEAIIYDITGKKHTVYYEGFLDCDDSYVLWHVNDISPKYHTRYSKVFFKQNIVSIEIKEEV